MLEIWSGRTQWAVKPTRLRQWDSCRSVELAAIASSESANLCSRLWVFDMKMSVIRSTVHNYTCIIGCGILHRFRISWHVMKAIRIFLLCPGLGSPCFLLILPTAALPLSSSGFTTWIRQTVYCISEHICFLLCSFFSVFTLFSCRFRAVDQADSCRLSSAR